MLPLTMNQLTRWLNHGRAGTTHRMLSCGGFLAPYDDLCARNHIDASWLAIARYMMTLEAEHLQPAGYGAALCLFNGFAQALTMFDVSLRPRPAFVIAPGTRLGMKSYLAGEAFTRWFAQDALKTSVVHQLEIQNGIVVTPAASQPAKCKPGGPAPRKNMGKKTRSDFVAFAGRTPHILESKGRSGRRVRDSDLERNLADALVQVSRFGTINGIVPATRTGCSFGFDLDGTRGTIWDPPEEVESFDVTVDLATLTQRYYAAFPPDTELAEFEDGFVGFEILRGVRFAVDHQVLETVRRLETDADALALFSLLQERREKLMDRDQRYLRDTGPDAIRLQLADGSLDVYARAFNRTVRTF